MNAFLGMGLLGTNFVRALRERGEEVRVWNRTASKAEALAADGAEVAKNAVEACRGARYIHLTLSDDAAVDAVLGVAQRGIEKDATIIDHTTTSAGGTAARCARFEEKGIAFQHAPVFMGPKNARDATGSMILSGPEDRYRELEPHLAPMTGKLVYLGARPDKAAAVKLLGNQIILSMTMMLADSLALAKAHGLEVADVESLLDWFNPGASFPARLTRLLAVDFKDPSWELAMARKDAHLMLDAARGAELPLMLIERIAETMDKKQEAGHGERDWTVIADDVINASR